VADAWRSGSCFGSWPWSGTRWDPGAR